MVSLRRVRKFMFKCDWACVCVYSRTNREVLCWSKAVCMYIFWAYVRSQMCFSHWVYLSLMRCQTPNGKWTGGSVLSFRKVITETYWFPRQAENISKPLLQLIIKLLMIWWLIVRRLTITAKSMLCFRITLCWTAAGLWKRSSRLLWWEMRLIR